jgi:sarcosine oxidase delta subunit
MARKKIGHVELQWTCPNCNGVNPGPEKHCGNCGAPQPDNVKFEQAERQELITDEEKIAQAEAGADIHCPYCGSRNSAGAEICHKCGGDLVAGVKRESGQVVGAYKTGPVSMIPCPHCGEENPKPVPIAEAALLRRLDEVNKFLQLQLSRNRELVLGL